METLFANLPSPLDLITDPVSLIIFGMYGLLMTWEALRPARKLPQVRFWKTKGLISFAVFFFLSSYLPIIWDVHLAAFQLLDLSSLGTVAGALTGVMIYQFGVYVWHRAMHKNNGLWKVFHQMHHSAERIDSFGTFFFSPWDMIGFTFLGSLCLVVIAGFSAEATTYIILANTFFSIFQHSNVRTPQWVGYLVQRPEAHAIHHARGIHAYNYSDISIYDILFGTFHNPKGYEHEAGFYDGASTRIMDMLKFRDVSSDIRTEETPETPSGHVL